MIHRTETSEGRQHTEMLPERAYLLCAPWSRLDLKTPVCSSLWNSQSCLTPAKSFSKSSGCRVRASRTACFVIPGNETKELPLEFRKDHEFSPSEEPLEIAGDFSHQEEDKLEFWLQLSRFPGSFASSVVLQSSLRTGLEGSLLTDEFGIWAP